MNGFLRVLMFIYSVIIGIFSVVLLYGLFDEYIFSRIIAPLPAVVSGPVSKYVYFAVLMLLFISAIVSISNSITYGSINRTRLRKTDIGVVDIGAGAIESIALNAAKSAQVGIKSARCHVAPAKNGAIKINLSCELYSNVEIPASMAKVQEKVKKDIERYTGIVVDAVSVKVAKVEATTAKVESR